MRLRQFSNKGLISRWPMNEGAGTTIKDAWRNGNDGDITGATWVAGKRLGRALKFDGSDDVVNCGNSTTFDATTNVTVMAWVNKAADTSDTTKPIIQKGDSTSKSYQLLLDFLSGNATVFRFWSGTTQHFAVGNATQVNKWLHITGTYDNAAVRLYEDGEEVKKTPSAETPINVVTDDVTIGGVGSKSFNGTIDDAKIYNRTLTPNEIKRQYSFTKYARALKLRGGL
jgi:hypothetical protein